MKMKIGIIGFGNMGLSLGMALAEEGYRIYACDKDKSKLKTVKNISVSKGWRGLIQKSSVIILAVKPQDIRAFMEEAKELILKYKPLIISIAAGVSTSFFEKRLPGIKIIRVMPNLAAVKRQAVSFITKGKFSKSPELKIAKRIFDCVGKSIIAKENFLDKATAISGSGPGYVYYFMDVIYESALKLGFSKNTAKEIVIQTVWGALNLIKNQKDDFKTWIKKVASPGGTTEAALTVFKDNNFKKVINKAVEAAYSKAKKLNVE